MDKCREEFEKIPYIQAILESVHSSIVWFGDGKYHTSFVGFDGAVNRLNGAWVVYQHQQAKVEELTRKLSAALGDLNVANKNLRDRFSAFQMVRQEADDLQKRVDTALETIATIAKDTTDRDTYLELKDLEQALKGEV